MAVKTDGRRITRDDLEKAFAQTIGEGQTTAKAKLPQVAAVGGGVALVLLIVVYLLGRRSGRHQSAIVEVRRL